MKNSTKSKLVSLIIICSVVYLDFLTKFLSKKFLSQVSTVPILNGVLHLTYVENTGAAFGMLKDHRWVFIVFSAIAILALLWYIFFRKHDSMLLTVSLAMICGGGIGNMIDRNVLGYVIDMIDFRLINFAVFNFADSCITVGTGLMILYLVLEIINEKKKPEKE